MNKLCLIALLLQMSTYDVYLASGVMITIRQLDGVAELDVLNLIRGDPQFRSNHRNHGLIPGRVATLLKVPRGEMSFLIKSHFLCTSPKLFASC